MRVCNAIAKVAAALKAQKNPKQLLFKKGCSIHFDKRTYSLEGTVLVFVQWVLLDPLNKYLTGSMMKMKMGYALTCFFSIFLQDDEISDSIQL